jgi:hypothetical protein
MKKSQAVEEEMEDTELFKKPFWRKTYRQSKYCRYKNHTSQKVDAQTLANAQQPKVVLSKSLQKFRILKRS